MPANPEQLVSEGIVAIARVDAAVLAALGRSTDVLVRWKRRKATALPRAAFVAGPAQPAGGLGETYDVHVFIRAEATDAAKANDLVHAIVESLTTTAFTAHGLDAMVSEWEYDNPQDDGGDEDSNDASVTIAEADFVINLTL